MLPPGARPRRRWIGMDYLGPARRAENRCYPGRRSAVSSADLGLATPRSGRARACYDGPSMGPTNPERTVHPAPIVAACLLCLGVFICAFQPARSDAGRASVISPAAVHHYRVGTVARVPGGGNTQAWFNTTASVEEAGDERPVREGDLTALLFVVLPGSILGLLFGGRVCRRSEASLLSVRRLPSPIPALPPRNAAPCRLSVFLL